VGDTSSVAACDLDEAVSAEKATDEHAAQPKRQLSLQLHGRERSRPPPARRSLAPDARTQLGLAALRSRRYGKFSEKSGRKMRHASRIGAIFAALRVCGRSKNTNQAGAQRTLTTRIQSRAQKAA
jgi:hypothetical protein